MNSSMIPTFIPIFKQGDIFEMQAPLSWATRGLCLADKEYTWDVLRQLMPTGCLQQIC